MMGFGWMEGGMWLFWIALAAGLYFLFYARAEERYAWGEITAGELDGIRDKLWEE